MNKQTEVLITKLDSMIGKAMDDRANIGTAAAGVYIKVLIDCRNSIVLADASAQRILHGPDGSVVGVTNVRA